ncbi:hypothetical protein E2C01_100064 [Portunus trituberculatus]|uniref:Endonuclease/exonuclease/phosphatase domain-containing protein n=1 Tax=Portunus trituberculatus TaxID=210409 RepID=A0A5B7KGZ7_PORTR|nr:hypothetical protein [Portunus trituberculatus]
MGEEAWGDKFLNDEPARLDLVFTRDIQMNDDIRHKFPLGKSDHVILEMDIEEGKEDRDESYKGDQLNYRKADIENLKSYFKKVNWEEMENSETVQEKYNKTGVREYVPKYRPKEQGKKKIGLMQGVLGQRRKEMEHGKGGEETEIQKIRKASKQQEMNMLR